MADGPGDVGRDPFYLQWHITSRCDLTCAHCYRARRTGEPEASDLRTAFDRFLELLTELPQRRVRVQVTGGEPLLSPNLYRVLDWASEAGCETRVLSNGTAVNRAAARELKRLGCRSVQISLDGGPATHEALRGAGTWAAALRGADLLREQGVAVTFAMTLTTATIAVLEEFLRAAVEHADRVGFHRLVPVGRGRELAGQVLPPEGLRDAFGRIWRARGEYPGLQFSLRDPIWRAYLGGPVSCRKVAGCTAAHGGICLEADGTVYPCRRLPLEAGNALRDDLRSIWRGELFRRLRDRRELGGACSRCVYLHVCGGCRAVALACRSSAFAADPQCFRRPGILERPLREIARRTRRAASALAG